MNAVDVIFWICLVLGEALALWLLLAGLAAVLFNRPLGVVAGASERLQAAREQGEELSVRALGALVLIPAVVVGAATALFPPVALLFVFLAVRRYFARRRQAESKYAGLRVLK